MTEKQCIEKSSLPVTKESIVSDLRSAGLHQGQTVIVHSSLKSLGWVCGGAQSVILALQEILTPYGNLIMPTHSSSNTNPKDWQHPAVPDHWVPIIQDSMPAFHPNMTPTRGMGQIPELFRTFPNVIRSYHPSVSFCAWGKDKEYITNNHSLNFPLGEQSPLSRIYDLNASILLLGVDHDSNTSLHLAEYRQDHTQATKGSGAILQNEYSRWVEFDDIILNDDIFLQIGAAYENEFQLTPFFVGTAKCKLIPQAPLINFAVNWLNHKT